MNFLAHAWLARGGSDDFLYGNLIADGVKGADLSAWRDEIAVGIRHHRRVDAFVDAHPVIAEVRERAPQRQRRFVGIALDLVWDHFVALEVCRGGAGEAVIQRSYTLLADRGAPARLSGMIPVLVEQDWLHRYADFTFTCRAIRGIGQRLSGPNRLAELVPWLAADYPALAADFQRLWPAVNARLAVLTPRAATDTRPGRRER